VNDPVGPEPGTIDWVLATTRTVRKRLDLDRPVDLGVVRECLELALQAPTGGDVQGWRWIVVTDPAVKARLRDLYLESHEVASGGRRPVEVVGSDDRMLDGAWHLATNLDRVPVLVVACIRGQLTPDSTLARAGALFASIYPAVWSLQLALRSRGLASAMTTVHLERHAAVAAALGIPGGVTQAALIPIAHLLGPDLRPARRRPVREVAYRDQWGTPWDDEPAG
jgi:nitroreductase